MTYETITLVGGPCDGETRSWDGGNWLEVKEKPTTKLFGRATAAFREAMIRTHLYSRDAEDRSRFVYQGVGK